MQCPTIFRKYAKLKNKFKSPPKARHNNATSIPFCYKELTRNLTTNAVFPRGKYWQLQHFETLCERKLHLLLKFLYFVDSEGKMKQLVVPGDCGN